MMYYACPIWRFAALTYAGGCYKQVPCYECPLVC